MNRVIQNQGKSIEKQGSSLGAVIVVKVDYLAVRHTIGLVGVMYQMSIHGGAWIATVAGLEYNSPARGKVNGGFRRISIACLQQ